MVEEVTTSAVNDGHVAATEGEAHATTAPTHVNAAKQPPPEKPQSIRTRTWVVLSFWVVILCLGLPMWWKTTSIYRAELPFEDMLEWDQGSVCLPSFPLEIKIAAPIVPCTSAKQFLQTTQHALDDLNEFSPHHLRLRLVDAKSASSVAGDAECNTEETGIHDAEAALTVKLVPRDEQPPELQLQTFSTDAVLYYSSTHLPSYSSSTPQLSMFLASQLHNLFQEEQASIAYRFVTQGTSHSPGPSSRTTTKTNGNPGTFVRSLPKDLQEKISTRDTRSFKYSDTYHLTFSLFSAEATPSSWDIADALDDHIRPWVDALSTISHFTINSQIQLYSRFSPSVHLSKDMVTNETHIAQADLSAFVNAAEWPLSPSIGSHGPTINFVLYIPSVSQSPLTIAGTNGATEWLIPQWGGVAIYNPVITDTGALSVPKHLEPLDMAPAFTTFRSQLLSLLGLPGDNEVSLPLRIQSLKRLQTTSLYLSASSTLGSLARLTQSLPSIPIPLSVSRSVEATISSLKGACAALTSGRFDEALQHVRQAEVQAEQAFFEKSMVGQVYFPDEHKIAVYLPLLGPVSFPLILGLVRELKRFLSSRKGKSQK